MPQCWGKKASSKLEQAFHKGKQTRLFTYHDSKWLQRQQSQQRGKERLKNLNFCKTVGGFGGEQNANKQSANNKQVKNESSTYRMKQEK